MALKIGNGGGRSMEDFKHAMSVEQAVDVAGSRRLFAEIREGRITARKAGRQTIITAAALDAWLKSLRIKAMKGGDHA
jgi:hypothetical protein